MKINVLDKSGVAPARQIRDNVADLARQILPLSLPWKETVNHNFLACP
jgi:hypothetical protein